MARTSLVALGVMALGGAGCLITERPDFQEPEVSAPLLTNFQPLPTNILEIPKKPGSTQTGNDYVENVKISFDILSEDRQKALYAAVFIDYQRPTEALIDCPLRPGTGTLAEARRQECTLVIKPSVQPGCRSITALASHDPLVYTGRVGDGSDLAVATWWAQIGIEESKYAVCEPFETRTDAGADVRAEGGPL